MLDRALSGDARVGGYGAAPDVCADERGVRVRSDGAGTRDAAAGDDGGVDAHDDDADDDSTAEEDMAGRPEADKGRQMGCLTTR